MILPRPVMFLTACEYKEVELGKALGDELFVALHLVMKGCNGYMKNLQNYHTEQQESLNMRGLICLSKLRMTQLENYEEVPSPEEIRDIVAQCVTARDTFSTYFIGEVKKDNEKKEVLVVSERDNSNVRRRIEKLKESFRGAQLQKLLYEILKMPASAVGTCSSFHNSRLLMEVAMRQFGIALLVVHDDDIVKDTLPYQTTNYLDQMGWGVFLPITFGLIHIAKDGNVVSILRKRRPMAKDQQGKQCCEGYALDLIDDIRKNDGVNLLTGLFDLSYTKFVEFIHQNLQAQREIGYLLRDIDPVVNYHSAKYSYLSNLKAKWDKSQEEMQDKAHKDKACK